MEEIKKLLMEEAGYSIEYLNGLSKTELLDTWLQWEGICGYTHDIIDTIERIWKVELND